MLNSSNQKVSSLKKVSFNDGLCDIYSLAPKGRELGKKLGTFYFCNDTIGIKSYYTSLHIEGMKIDKTISIPYNKLIDNSKVVMIEGEAYEISLLQPKDTFPKSLRLTLTKANIKYRSNDDQIQ